MSGRLRSAGAGRDCARRLRAFVPALCPRPTADAEQVHRPYLAQLVEDHGVITLASEESGLMTGFLIATLANAPNVYDPGGLTCMIDDFVVTPDRWATTGPLLLRSAIDQAAQRVAVQAVVVTGHLDHPKREALRSCGLSMDPDARLRRAELGMKSRSTVIRPPSAPSRSLASVTVGIRKGITHHGRE